MQVASSAGDQHRRGRGGLGNGRVGQPRSGARASRGGRALSLQGDGDLRWRLTCQMTKGDGRGLGGIDGGDSRAVSRLGAACRLHTCRYLPAASTRCSQPRPAQVLLATRRIKLMHGPDGNRNSVGGHLRPSAMLFSYSGFYATGTHDHVRTRPRFGLHDGAPRLITSQPKSKHV